MGLIMLYLFVAGLFFGSFFNVVATRLPENESIIKPGSHCTNCKHKLSWYELIPVFSYLFLKGRCKKCKTKLSFLYPFTELLTGALYALSFYIFGFSYMTLISIVISSITIITIVSDFLYYVILDEVLVVGSIFIFIIDLIFIGFKSTMIQLLYGLIVFLILLIIKFLGDKGFKRESLGWGDVKLSFVVGFIMDVKFGLLYLCLGAFIALPYALINRNEERLIPFGPFLVISMLLIYWNQQHVIDFLNIFWGGIL